MPELPPLILNPPLNVTVIRDAAGLAALGDFFQREKIIGCDIETNPLKDFFYRRTRTIQFGNATEQYVIDLLAFCSDADALFQAQGHYGLHLPASLQPVIDLIQPVLCSVDWLKVGVNLSFEYQNFYWQFGLRTQHFFDCAMVERCIWAGALGSMKQYAFFSMEQMMARYFQVQIDKSLQESFTVDAQLTPQQYQYAALDTRLPLALRSIQMMVLEGHTPASLHERGLHGAAKRLEQLDPIIFGDDLREIAQIENDAIGAFEDMHVHGERIDRQPWLERVAKRKVELSAVIATQLDPIFLPLVGSKRDLITDEQITAAEVKWKALNTVTPQETALKASIRSAKSNPVRQAELEAQRLQLEAARKAEKELYKAEHSTLKKKRTKIKNLSAKCQGEALINYDSGAQLLNVLRGMKGLARLADTDDGTLEKFAHIPAIAALRKHRELAKEIGTYGDAWATEWTTKPCKQEGWLHPGDGRLHCVFNQYDAETGRSTSERPNGQTLPQDKAVRSCFIADPPDESMRISTCCDAEAYILECASGKYDSIWKCPTCNNDCQTKPEEFCIVTADMSGAELRIIAELADDPIWIGAFNRGEDVHSVGTELLYPEQWPLQRLPTCAYYVLHTAETVAKNPLCTIGDPQRQKCNCPEHKELRDYNKSTNFLLAYGGGPPTLAARIKQPVEVARELMAKHEAAFPNIWKYLDQSGRMAKMRKKSFDMFGRRRLFPEPTWDRAREKAKDDREKKLRFTDDGQQRHIANFIQLHNRSPKGKLTDVDSEMYFLTHRPPTSAEIGNAYQAMHGIIERAGKNHAIQGTNATIAKVALGCGYDREGKPFLWHIFPRYKARLIKFVHDEIVVQTPRRYGQAVAEEIRSAFRRAASLKMSKVVMECDFNIAGHWAK